MEKKAMILLVDDNKQTVDSLRFLLSRKLDAEIKVAYDGADGVKLARELKPDLIVLDLRMPVLDGFQVLEQLKRHEVETRVIILSGENDIPTIIRCIRAGACDYLVKAIEANDLADHIRRSLVLETAFNLRIAQAPAIILELLARAENLEKVIRNDETEKRRREVEDENARKKHALALEQEQRRGTLLDGCLVVATGVVYAAVALGVVWAMHSMGIVQSGKAVLGFFLLLVFLLLIPTKRLREAALSWFGAKAKIKTE